MRFCLEVLTKRPTLSFHSEPENVKIYSLPLGMTLFLGTDMKKECIWKVHSKERMEAIGMDKEKDLLILILRDYKECLLRDLGDIQTAKEELNEPDPSYFANLALFDAWDEKRKLLVYYEDLLAELRRELERVLLFLGEDTSSLDPFMDQLDYYKMLSLEFYSMYVGPTLSRGEDILFHTKHNPEAFLLDEIAHAKFPSLWEKYLTRFELDVE